jgi:hypothetical protein
LHQYPARTLFVECFPLAPEVRLAGNAGTTSMVLLEISALKVQPGRKQLISP